MILACYIYDMGGADTSELGLQQLSALLYSSEGTHVHTLPQITAASSTAVAAAGGRIDNTSCVGI